MPANNCGLTLFNRISQQQAQRTADFYSSQEDDLDVQTLGDLYEFQRAHQFPCETSRFHDHYHAPAEVGSGMHTFYHRPQKTESQGQENSQAKNNENSLVFGPWKQELYYSEDLQLEQQDILVQWFNSFLFGISSKKKTSFNFDKFYR